MTNWLKWRLCALMGGALLIGGANYLQAQNDYPAPAKTPEAAAKDFYQLLYQAKNLRKNVPDTIQGQLENPFFSPDPDPFMGSISRAQIQAFPVDLRGGVIYEVLSVLFKEQEDAPFDARATGTSGSQTIVEVSPSTGPKSTDVVVIQEDGGYRVDLKATLGRHKNLSGEKLDQEWFDYSGIVSPALAQSSNFQRSQCQSQLKQQMLGVLQYVQDYDEKLPLARKWIDVVQPYVKSEEIFQCPSLPNKGKGYGYAFNQNLSQLSQANIQSTATTANIYEVSDLSRNKFGPGTGRAYRHMDGLNVGFADGHVKWYKRGNDTKSVVFKP